MESVDLFSQGDEFYVPLYVAPGTSNAPRDVVGAVAILPGPGWLEEVHEICTEIAPITNIYCGGPMIEDQVVDRVGRELAAISYTTDPSLVMEATVKDDEYYDSYYYDYEDSMFGKMSWTYDVEIPRSGASAGRGSGGTGPRFVITDKLADFETAGGYHAQLVSSMAVSGVTSWYQCDYRDLQGLNVAILEPDYAFGDVEYIPGEVRDALPDKAHRIACMSLLCVSDHGRYLPGLDRFHRLWPYVCATTCATIVADVHQVLP